MFTARVDRNQKLDVAKIAALLKGPTKVKVGFPAGKVESDIVQRAVWNEFGTRGGASGGGWGGPVPERPFMRNTMRAKRGKYQKSMAAGARAILRGSTAIGEVLRGLGVSAQGDMQHEISTLTSPPNSPVTIKLKGAGKKPLIDEGDMRTRLTFMVDDGA
ncbi:MULTISPECIES: hypothetical protein [unclassified Aureimonas]|uniref:hypothetical protein n=1 Tax=unclassified Aureimonas TaxID=2615206 RepID=UPI0006F92436|nr:MULTISPECIES: hypothetical protein [unclassified Aureimonas]KQT52218.1 hypothetical protein ASG62_16300 [Aureimonas sp. Leaf427]KQT70548.1 hypothetical protein ASG54_21650 [Aureimonas sp. Leaf460]